MVLMCPETFDLPYITRKWHDCQLPKVKSLNILNECMDFTPDSLYMELDIRDVWTLHSYLLNNFASTLAISKVKNYWKIKFSSSSVMLAFMNWIAVNSAIFLSQIPVAEKPTSVDCHVSLDKTVKESFTVFFANTMALGNIIEGSFDKETKTHYKFREIVSHESLSCFFLPNNQHDAVSFSSISMQVDITKNIICIYIRLLRQTYPTWFKIVIPFHFLVPGNIPMQETPLEKTPGFFNVTLCLRLLCAPLVYRQPYLDKREILDSPNKTPDLSLQWVRDYNPITEMYCTAQTNLTAQDHPLSALQQSWCICLTRGCVPSCTLARFKKYLYRASLLHKSSNIGITLLPSYSGLHEQQFQRYMKKLKRYRPQYIVLLLIALMSRGAIPDPLCLRLDPQLASLCEPEAYSDTLIFDTLNVAFLKFQHSSFNCTFSGLYHRCLKYCSSLQSSGHAKIAIPKNLQFSITITPFKIYLIPEYEWLENRVLRTFNKKELDFFRVNFRDEGCIATESSDNSDHLILRIKHIMDNGIILYSWKLLFFGYSQSQLKSSGCWFVHKKKQNINIESVLESFGNFSTCLQTGKMMAHLGLLFSSAISFVGLEENQFILIDDIESLRNPSNPSLGSYNFTDGVGFCSRKFLEQVQIKNSLNFLPSAIQIRYKGFKGMLCYYPEWFRNKWTQSTSHNAKTLSVVFRMSMRKFISKNTTLDILAYSSYRPSHFNKQILLALDSLGVNWNIFLDLLNEQLTLMSDSRTTPQKAIQFLQSASCISDSIYLLRCLLNNRISIQEPFIQSCLKLLIENETRLVLESSWIHSSFCCNLFGVADESRTLKYDHGNGLPEVFVKLRKPIYTTSVPLVDMEYEEVILQGVVLIAKAPILYPGDCQLCYAVDNAHLNCIENVVVFPTNIPEGSDPSCLHKSHPAHIHPNDPTYIDNSVLKRQYGFRDIPSMMSGSDLDGDQYFICWEPRIVSHLWELHLKQKSIKPAGFYTVLPNEAKPSFDAYLSLHERLKNHYLSSLQDRSLCLVASCHIRKSHDPEIYAAGKSLHSTTIQLAYLHSEAVDAVKTGKSVVLKSFHYNTTTPHFHTQYKLSDRNPVHKSVSLLGKIYDKATQCSKSVFLKTQSTKKKITFLRYDKMDNPSEENGNIGFYWLRFEWKVKRLSSNNVSMISNIYVYEYDELPFSNKSMKLRLFHCPIYVNLFDLCVLHKPQKTQYITFDVQVGSESCSSRHIRISNPVITLKNEEQVVSHSKDNSEDTSECYTCLYLYNSPFKYGTDLLSFISENITLLSKTTFHFDIHIIDSFTQMCDVNNPAKIYNDCKNTDNQLNHFKMMIQSEPLHIETLLLQLTDSPPITLDYSLEYLTSDISLCKLTSHCSTFLSTRMFFFSIVKKKYFSFRSFRNVR
ncbi:uncharacterized protein LOC128882867 [Hylaeus volcanicus]|uniref:uncharacterized protein LOC128882867 n=1 Tax=Hylaeus volcanicus TaxID=313075 RepID=UPI0023B8331F|nr:uncharacterized protein LOC128882867 [Hylaeus volcanicus]